MIGIRVRWSRLLLSVFACLVVSAATSWWTGTHTLAQSTRNVEGRIIVWVPADGKIEFGFLVDEARIIRPESRFFPDDALLHRWLDSSEIVDDGETLGFVSARLVSRGRIEFGFTPAGGERILPRSRFLPADSEVGRYRSSLIEFSINTSSTLSQIQSYSPGDATSGDSADDSTDESPSPDSQPTTDEGKQLAEQLFQYGESLAYGYNNYGPNEDGSCHPFEHSHNSYRHYGDPCGDDSHPPTPGYRGGHSGWDAYRYSDGHRAHAFHSLTAGTIVCLRDSYGHIAVKDADGYITRYLHGQRDEGLYVGKSVAQFDPLGVTAGLGRGGVTEFSPHVHVEVAKPGTRACSISSGAGDDSGVEPVAYLYAALP